MKRKVDAKTGLIIKKDSQIIIDLEDAFFSSLRTAEGALNELQKSEIPIQKKNELEQIIADNIIYAISLREIRGYNSLVGERFNEVYSKYSKYTRNRTKN